MPDSNGSEEKHPLPLSPALAARLAAIAAERSAGTPPAHDYGHILRVAENARRLSRAEGADIAVTVPAALLHELVNLPKNHPDSPRSGELCAAEAEQVLRAEGYPAALLPLVARAIADHPYSLGKIPDTLEGRILQDADRLDAIGAIGIARCFAVSGELNRPLLAPEDPFCLRREPDDRSYALDHFYKKLLRVADGMHTPSARKEAELRTTFLRRFLDQLAEEIGTGAGSGHSL